MSQPPVFESPSANLPSGVRARLARRLRARLRGTPMCNFREGGPRGRFVLVRDRSGECEPILLLSSSVQEGVCHEELTSALLETPKAELIPGTWARRTHTVTFRADGAQIDSRDFRGALGRSGAEYRVLLLEVAA
ncbi:MAG: hypothetical protein KDA24_11360 [Deltaproteobacteria bacterium]|nr:hypothetical protein [Deltaproteobacteria bacterium]